LKARAAALKVKSGIIISADTIVTDGKHVFGKPANLKAPAKCLKNFPAGRSGFISGVCVLDIDNRVTKTACEKTKIYMDKLSDKEINAYFKIVFL